MLLLRFSLLLSCVFSAVIPKETFDWVSTELTAFPWLQEDQVSFKSDGNVLRVNTRYYLHSSTNLQQGVEISSEHQEEPKRLTKFFRRKWKKSYTEFEIVVQVKEGSAAECENSAVILVRQDYSYDYILHKVVQRAYGPQDVMRYTQRHLDPQTKEKFFLAIEGKQECSFDVQTAKKRYNKERVKGAYNFRPMQRKEEKEAVVQSLKKEVPNTTPIFDPTEIYWTVEKPTAFPIFVDWKETFVMKNQVFDLTLDEAVVLHLAPDLSSNLYIPPEMKKPADGMEIWRAWTSTVKFVLNLKETGDCSKDAVILSRVYWNVYGQVYRIAKVAEATTGDEVLEYSEQRRPGRKFAYQVLHTEKEESAEFSGDSSYESPDREPCRFQITSASKEYAWSS